MPARSEVSTLPSWKRTIKCAACQYEGALPWLCLSLCIWPGPDSSCLLGAAEDVVNARAHFHGLRVARPEEALCIAEDGLVIGSGSDCSAKLSSDKVGIGFPPGVYMLAAAAAVPRAHC